MLTALLFALAVPTMTCKGVTATQFCCVANGLEGRAAHWQVFDFQEPDRTDGESACFKATKEWRVVQLKVDDAEDTVWTLRAIVRSDGAKVLFAPYKGVGE